MHLSKYCRYDTTPRALTSSSRHIFRRKPILTIACALATPPPFRSSGAVTTAALTPQRVDLPLPLWVLQRRCRRSAPAMRCRPSSQSRGTSICRCHCARSVDPTALPLRRRGADRRLDAAAHRSAAGAARAPANPPPFRSGSASPTIVPVRGASVLTVVPTPQRVDLPLLLRALRRTYRRSTPAVRRRPSSRSRGASIYRCHCALSGDPTALPLRRLGADRRPDAAARRSAAAAARAPATLSLLHSGSAAPNNVLVPRGDNLPLPLCAL